MRPSLIGGCVPYRGPPRSTPMTGSGAVPSAAVLRCLLILLALAACRSGAAAAADIEVAGAQIHLELAGGDFTGGAAPLTDWVRRAAGIVAGYYGRFPVAQL